MSPVPGGRLEARENSTEAAIREVLEETSVKIRCQWVLAVRVHPRTGAHIAYSACTAGDGTDPVAAPREALTAAWWPIERALAEAVAHHADLRANDVEQVTGPLADHAEARRLGERSLAVRVDLLREWRRGRPGDVLEGHGTLLTSAAASSAASTAT